MILIPVIDPPAFTIFPEPWGPLESCNFGNQVLGVPQFFPLLEWCRLPLDLQRRPGKVFGRKPFLVPGKFFEVRLIAITTYYRYKSSKRVQKMFDVYLFLPRMCLKDTLYRNATLNHHSPYAADFCIWEEFYHVLFDCGRLLMKRECWKRSVDCRNFKDCFPESYLVDLATFSHFFFIIRTFGLWSTGADEIIDVLGSEFGVWRGSRSTSSITVEYSSTS